MRCFQNIATLIRTKRMNHPKGYSQSELSHILGYKNGQFISNVERALCNIPLKMLKRVTEVLDITKEELVQAIIEDQKHTLESYLAQDNSKRNFRASDNVQEDDQQKLRQAVGFGQPFTQSK